MEPHYITVGIAGTGAMGIEAGYTPYFGGWQARFRAQKLIDRATALAERVRHPHALAISFLGAEFAAFLEGQWETSWERAQKCEEILHKCV